MWRVDLVYDVTQHGATVRFLTIIDEVAHFAISSRVPDSEPEMSSGPCELRFRSMTCRDICAVTTVASLSRRCCGDWLLQTGIKARFIEPGSPWQNGINESFNACLRDECLNRELLANVLEAQVIVRQFRDEYNQIPLTAH